MSNQKPKTMNSITSFVVKAKDAIYNRIFSYVSISSTKGTSKSSGKNTSATDSGNDTKSEEFDIKDIVAEEIMVPRSDIIAVESNASLHDICSVFNEFGHTRLIVYKNKDIDNVLGFIHLRDIFSIFSSNYALMSEMTEKANKERFINQKKDIKKDKNIDNKKDPKSNSSSKSFAAEKISHKVASIRSFNKFGEIQESATKQNLGQNYKDIATNDFDYKSESREESKANMISSSRKSLDDFNLEKVIRKLIITTPSTKALDIFNAMRKKRTHIALVVDEYGGSLGIITLENIIESQLRAKIGDEYDDDDESSDDINIIQNSDGSFIVSGRAKIEELKQYIQYFEDDEERSSNEIEEEYETIAGFLMLKAGHVPKTGEKITIDDSLICTILDATERAVKKIKIVCTSKIGKSD